MSNELTPVADLLWRAANKHLNATAKLWHGNGNGGGEFYTCDAIGRAAWVAGGPEKEARALVDELGLDAYKQRQFSAFNEFRPGPECQGARYAWLMFASLYAQELGI